MLKKSDWNKLLESIGQRNAVLLIGDNLTMVKDNNSESEQTLIEYISSKLYDHVEKYYLDEFKRQRRTKSEIKKAMQNEVKLPSNRMVMDMNWCNHSIAFKNTKEGSVDFFIKTLIDDIPEKNLDYQKIEKLLSIDRFNVILSTSYSSTYKKIVENWAAKNGRSFIYGEINSGAIRLTPLSEWRGEKDQLLFINLMGRIDAPTKSLNHLVVTEEDMILFIMSWIAAFSGNAHRDLKTCLDNHFLLVLGCNVPSWAFRFMWYVIKNPSGKKENPLKSVCLRPTPWNANVHDFIVHYKSTIVIDAENTDDFIDDLTENWGSCCYNIPEHNTEIDTPPTSVDIFVSYASEDRSIIVDNILPILEPLQKEYGYTIWYDKNCLRPGDEWEYEIHHAIENSHVFLTLQTPNSFKVANNNKQRYLRQEWIKARKTQDNKSLEEQKYHFILPVIFGPKEKVLYSIFSRYQSIDMETDDFATQLTTSIKRLIKENKSSE